MNRDISASGQLTDPARIALGLGQRQVSGYGHDAENFQLCWRRQRQQNRGGIVNARSGLPVPVLITRNDIFMILVFPNLD